MGPSQAGNGNHNAPSGDARSGIQHASVRSLSEDAREDIHSTPGVPVADEETHVVANAQPAALDSGASTYAQLVNLAAAGLGVRLGAPPESRTGPSYSTSDPSGPPLQAPTASETTSNLQLLTSNIQNFQCSGPISDTGPSAALGDTAFNQGNEEQQGVDAMAGGQLALDLSSDPLAAFFSGMGWHGLQIPTQSVVVNTKTTPAARMPPPQNQATTSNVPPLPAHTKAAPLQPLALPNTPNQRLQAPAVAAPPGQPLGAPIPLGQIAPAPVQSVPPAMPHPVMQGHMPLQLNPVPMPLQQPQLPQPPRPQINQPPSQQLLIRQQVTQQSMQAAFQLALHHRGPAQLPHRQPILLQSMQSPWPVMKPTIQPSHQQQMPQQLGVQPLMPQRQPQNRPGPQVNQ